MREIKGNCRRQEGDGQARKKKKRKGEKMCGCVDRTMNDKKKVSERKNGNEI